LGRRKLVTRDGLEKARSELSRELSGMNRRQREEYLKAAGQVYNGLAKMAKIRTNKH